MAVRTLIHRELLMIGSLACGAVLGPLGCGSDSEPARPEPEDTSTRGGADDAGANDASPGSPSDSDDSDDGGAPTGDTTEEASTREGDEGDGGSEASSANDGGAVDAAADGTDEGDSSEAQVEPEEPPLYAIATQDLDANSEPMSYVILTDSLTAELSLSDAVIELPGRGLAAGAVGAGALFVASDQSPNLTRYELRDGKLEKGDSISFLPQGVSGFSGYSAQFQFVDDDKAYWFSRAAERIVIWDPSEFVLKGNIPLPELNREGHVTSFTGAPIRDGDTLYSFVSWDVRSGGAVTVPETSALIIVDTKQDTAELLIDERCGYARDGVLVGDWLYIATEALGASVHYLNTDNGGAPCLIRFDTKTRTFDQSFKVELNSLADGAATGSLLVTPSGKPLIYVIDGDEADPLIPDPISNPRVLASADLWRTAEIELEGTPSLRFLDVPLRSASVLPFTLRNGIKVSTTFGDEKRIYEVTDDGLLGTKRVNGTVVGTVFSIVQLR